MSPQTDGSLEAATDRRHSQEDDQMGRLSRYKRPVEPSANEARSLEALVQCVKLDDLQEPRTSRTSDWRPKPDAD